MSIVPKKRPEQTEKNTRKILKKADVTDEVALLGVRAYFRDSMGLAGKNDLRMYDDAIMLVTRNGYKTFNANVDPQSIRPGHGTAESTKGMATLKDGLWRYKLGLHRGEYLALIQAGPVTIYRDADSQVPESKIVMHNGTRCYEETGYFGINIHHGNEWSVSSLGCQTIHPSQWDDFISSAKSALEQAKQKTIPYLLIDNS